MSPDIYLPHTVSNEDVCEKVLGDKNWWLRKFIWKMNWEDTEMFPSSRLSF